MKILIIDNAAISKRDGRFYVYKSTGEFGAELLNAGNSIEYFQFFRGGASSISSYDLIENGMEVYAIKMRSVKPFAYFLAYLHAIFRIIKSDFVYIFYPNSFSFLGFFTKLIGRKYGLYIRGEAGIDSSKSKWLYEGALVIFTVSEAFSNAVNLQFPSPKAYTIKPMITFSDRDIISDRDYSKKDHFKVLYLGRIDRNKGLFELLEAVASLHKSGFKFNLEIVGDGTCLEELKETAVKYKISDFVKFSGAVGDKDEIRKAYIRSDIYVLPTYHEGFPRTLYEAMIFGTPIVTTFVGGISSLMINHVNCFEIQPKSAYSIEEKLKFVMENYSFAGQVAMHAQSTVRPIVDSNRQTHASHLNEILRKYV